MIRIHRFYIIDSAQINIGRTNSTCGILSKANDNPIRPHNDTILQTSRAIPHKDCATDALSNFSSDETKSGVNTGCIHEHFCEI